MEAKRMSSLVKCKLWIKELLCTEYVQVKRAVSL